MAEVNHDRQQLLKVANKYTGKKKAANNKFPKHDQDPKNKELMKYFVDCSTYLFTLGANGKLTPGGILDTGDTGLFAELRAYARGNAPIDKYTDVLYGKSENEQKKAYNNISLRQDQGHVKVIDQILGNYEKQDFDLLVRAIDPDSSYSRELEKAGQKVWLNKTFKDVIQATAVAPSSGMPNIEFETEMEVELFAETGGLKLQTEIAMQKAIKATQQYCKWRALKAMFYADAVHLGIVATKDYIDNVTLMPKVRYVDPYYALIPRSIYDDFRDATMGGEFRYMTIAQIREESTDLEEHELQAIAKTWGYTSNSITNDRYGSTAKDTDNYPYDHIKVGVLDTAWISSDIEKFTKKRIKKYGNVEYNKVDYNYTLDEKEERRGKSLKVTKTQYTYKCKWIVGSQIAFDYGKDYYQVRKGEDGNKKATLPFHFGRVQGTSKVERMIPYIDDLNIATFKKRNAIAALPAPPGIIINKTALEDVDLDGEVKTASELWDLFLEKGYLAIDTHDDNGNLIHSLNNIMTTFQSKLIEIFTTYREEINDARRNIEIVTGWNDVIGGTSENERRLKVEGEAKLDAAINALQPEQSCMREVIQSTFDNILMRWQEVVRHKDFDIKYSPIDTSAIEFIKLTKHLSTVQFGLTVKLASTYQERQMMLQDIIMLRDSRRDKGVGGISQDVYVFIQRLIMEGQLQLAGIWLSKAIEKQRKQDEEASMRAQEQNGAIQERSIVATKTEERKGKMLDAMLNFVAEEQKFINAAALEVIKADVAADGELDDERAKATIDQFLQVLPQRQSIQDVFMQVEQMGQQPQQGQQQPQSPQQ